MTLPVFSTINACDGIAFGAALCIAKHDNI